nr:hypothetical protein [uncultured Methanolobus sp.]
MTSLSLREGTTMPINGRKKEVDLIARSEDEKLQAINVSCINAINQG